MAFKKFLKKNLERSAGGSETQQIRMGCIVATTQHFMGELTDQLSGEKN